MTKKIEKLVINSPYEEPSEHWGYWHEKQEFTLEKGRRPAGYTVATEGAESFNDPGQFIEIPLANEIRKRVKVWREQDYPGVTTITRTLLQHWADKHASPARFFFCQIEAIETLIWLVEAPESKRVGIDIPSDGGDFERVCSKMATGTGKTIVMAMLIAWQVLNKVTYSKDKRFSKHILVIAPGLTVKKRLSVLDPYPFEGMKLWETYYYRDFPIVPLYLMPKLRRGKVVIHNWHKLDWETEEQLEKRKSVDKRGVKSHEAYARGVLGSKIGSTARNILVINDEAHHAWRIQEGVTIKGVKKEEKEQATKWVGGLDKIHKARRILRAYDFSATPFIPLGKKSTQETLFHWIVSDFGLSDAIESGLVKTPRVVVRDDVGIDPKTYKSKLYHLYPNIKDDLNRKDNTSPLPHLLMVGYAFLGGDWDKTREKWAENPECPPTPPVMITVAHRTEVAARIKHAFVKNKIPTPVLCQEDGILHIDSKVLAEAEEAEVSSFSLTAPPKNKQERAEALRKQVDTVGKKGQPGGKIQNVIAVGMLSEGWDAKTVTHIMGLRAFSSQLLCEQVVGRGLRRISYEVNPETGLFEQEYVNVFGIPFTFLPHESQEGAAPPPQKPKVAIEPLKDRGHLTLQWPNIDRIEQIYCPILSLDWSKIDSLELSAADTPQIAELAPSIEGKEDVSKSKDITLEFLAQERRTEQVLFQTAQEVYEQMQENWKGAKSFLLAQLVGLVEDFMASETLSIIPKQWNKDELKRRLVMILNMNRIVNHIWSAIRFENVKSREVILDNERPRSSTADMGLWYTGKPCGKTKKSHINFCVYDSTWEGSVGYALDRSDLVEAWVKNDHIGFEIPYFYQGIVRKYVPDFLIRLKGGMHLILEVKGKEKESDKAKQKFLEQWVKAVNNDRGFGVWACDVLKNISALEDILHTHRTQ